MPWAWGTGLSTPTGAYHLVWARDLDEMATGLIADGDRAAAVRALEYLFRYQQEANGSFPANSLRASQSSAALQLDDSVPSCSTSSARPTRRTGRMSSGRGFLISYSSGGFGRPGAGGAWENQSGYSPPPSPPGSPAWSAPPGSRRPTGRPRSPSLPGRGRPMAAQGRAVDGDHQRALFAEAVLPAAVQRTATRTRPPRTRSATAAVPPSTSAASWTRASLSWSRGLGAGQQPPPCANTLKVVNAPARRADHGGPAVAQVSQDGDGETADRRPVNRTAGQLRDRGRLWVLLAGERGE